jgi:hypothetical protein
MTHAKPAGAADVKYFNSLVKIMGGAVGHATKAAHVLAVVHVIPQLR